MADKSDVPPPTSYSPVHTDFRSRTPSFSLVGRAKTCYFDPGPEVLMKPSPNQYQITESQVKNTRFAKPTMGFGNKMLGYYGPPGRRDSTPGPVDYKLDDIFSIYS